MQMMKMMLTTTLVPDSATFPIGYPDVPCSQHVTGLACSPMCRGTWQTLDVHVLKRVLKSALMLTLKDVMRQVVLLDPVQYPGAMKAFAREVCRNDLLNFGRLHFFFPDSRMSLDLNTDKTLKVWPSLDKLQAYLLHRDICCTLLR